MKIIPTKKAFETFRRAELNAFRLSSHAVPEPLQTVSHLCNPSPASGHTGSTCKVHVATRENNGLSKTMQQETSRQQIAFDTCH
jgi:hypothetical protein